MKSNILILVLDSFRADKFFGKNKTSKTPNLDNIIKNGTYFTQCISSSDQTGTSLASIFTGFFPINSGLNQFTYKKENNSFFDILKENGYKTYSIIPDVEFFSTISDRFDEKITYPFEDKNAWLKINNGLGDKIIDFLKEIHEPWACYIHIMDIRPPFDTTQEFEDEIYGKTNYDKLISSIDKWFGDFFKKIDSNNTLLIVTADHGEYIPVTGENIFEITPAQKALSKGIKSVPFLKGIGTKALLNLRFATQTYKKEKLKRSLSPYELRSFNSRSMLDLFDEIIRVPLLFVGSKVPTNKIINNLVRHVDVFPTILDLVEIENKTNCDGRTLQPLIRDETQEELPAYIEVGINLSQLMNEKAQIKSKVIGIRTSEYKYYRSSENKDKNQKLFDLKNDPREENNISTNSNLVTKMESILSNIQKTNKNTDKISEEEIKKARDILMKLGYI